MPTNHFPFVQLTFLCRDGNCMVMSHTTQQNLPIISPQAAFLPCVLFSSFFYIQWQMQVHSYTTMALSWLPLAGKGVSFHVLVCHLFGLVCGTDIICQCVSLVKGLLTFPDSFPSVWLHWNKMISPTTTPAVVSSGEQELTQIRWRKEERQSWSTRGWLMHYIYRNVRHKENYKGKAGVSKSYSSYLL